MKEMRPKPGLEHSWESGGKAQNRILNIKPNISPIMLNNNRPIVSLKTKILSAVIGSLQKINIKMIIQKYSG